MLGAFPLFLCGIMTNDLNELAGYYASLTDDELLRRSAKDLTAEARVLVDKELESRRLASATAREESVPEVTAVREEAGLTSVELIDVAQFYDPAEAYLLKGYLESFGIPATIIGADVARTFSGVVGGSRLSVPKPLVAQALERIEEYNESHASPEESANDGVPQGADQPSGGRLKTYRVYAHPGRSTPVVVRSGFNWAALIFGPLWFLVNRMWVNALIFVTLFVGNALYVPNTHPVSEMELRIDDVMVFLYPVVWLLFSALANTLLCSDLEGKGYVLRATVRARNPAYAREAALNVERES